PAPANSTINMSSLREPAALVAWVIDCDAAEGSASAPCTPRRTLALVAADGVSAARPASRIAWAAGESLLIPWPPCAQDGERRHFRTRPVPRAAANRWC